WLCLCISYFFLCRASELFAYSNGKIHKDFGLTRGDIAFKRNGVQCVHVGEWHQADCVEMRFRASKSDQGRKGAVLLRSRTNKPGNAQPLMVGNLLGAGGGGFETVRELMLMHPNLGAEVPLAAFPSGKTWTVWTRSQATFALRALVQHQGLQPLEYALHSGRIGGATRLAAAGLQPAVI
ncbi:unnamed protein product, partial [Sphacelaria rigidula]